MFVLFCCLDWLIWWCLDVCFNACCVYWLTMGLFGVFDLFAIGDWFTLLLLVVLSVVRLDLVVFDW